MITRIVTNMRIEAEANGVIFFRLEKQTIVNGVTSSDRQYHRSGVMPGQNIDAQIAAVNADIARDGYAPIDTSDVARLKAFVAIAWTPEVVAAYQAAMVAKPI